MSDESASPEIPFDPVPVRARHDGWTPERQRAFLAALARCGSVSAAARALGKTRRSAYLLRERPGAESFAAAWDAAAERGADNLRDHVIERALHGAVVPRFHRGRITGLVHRYYDHMAVAVLGGRGIGMADRLRKAADKGAMDAYFNIERAWQRTFDDYEEERNRRMILEERLARLAAAGLIGREWLDYAIPHPPLPRPLGIRML